MSRAQKAIGTLTECGGGPTIVFSVFDGPSLHGLPALSEGSSALLLAATRIRAARGRAVVVKLGGSALEDPAATCGMLDAVAALHAFGLKLILVHGGGKPIDRAMDAAGLTPRKIQGLRCTDDETLAIVVRVLSEINRSLVLQLLDRDADAAAVPEGVIGQRLTTPAGLGHVGRVTGLKRTHFPADPDLSGLLVIPSLALDADDGGWLNVNADSVAAGIARVLGAEAVLFLTDTPGVLKDRSDPESRCRRLTVAECRTLIVDGVIDGGMIPKVEACFEALEAGAARAVILDGRDIHSLLDDFLQPGSTGTEIVK